MNAANAMTFTFHRGALALALLLSLAAATPAAHAQPAPAPATAAEPLVPVFAPDPALLADFGGVEGVQKLSALFVDNMKADPRIAHYFEKTKLPELKKQLADHLCQVLAGPCVYEGDTMKASHADLKISKADSLAQVEVLQATMDNLGIPFGSQNRLLARLAPMYRQIITR